MASQSAFAMYAEVKRQSGNLDESKTTPKKRKRAHSSSQSESEIKTPNSTLKKSISNGSKQETIKSFLTNGEAKKNVVDEDSFVKPSPAKKKTPKKSKQIDTELNGVERNSNDNGEFVQASPAKKKTPKKSNQNGTNLNKFLKTPEAEKLTKNLKKSTPKKSPGSKKQKSDLNSSFKGEKKQRKSEKLNSSIPLLEPVRPLYEEENTNTVNPFEESSTLFAWLIESMSVEEFLKKTWEKAPLHIKRNNKNFYKMLISTPMIDDILRKFNIFFTKNIDITSYSNGQRETHNPPGRALPSVVWDYYSNGCSVRLLNPQTFIPNLQSLNAGLQEYFGCFVGANSYLTPPDSQGFAPHYDDIEAFILQIEGKKRWRLYNPRNSAEHLPRYSSKNFDQNEIGEPILDVIVEAGDLLYFPRGTIHQGETVSDCHSLHLTLSCYQKNSWADYLEKLVPEALEKSIKSNSEFRKGLPIDYLHEIGNVHSDNDSEFRKKFIENAKKLMHKMIDSIDVDKAADQMAKGHIHDFLPPMLAPVELECSVLQDGERMIAQGAVINRVEIEPDTKIRLSRAHCVRLVKEEDDTWKVYYSTDNSNEYHEYEVQFLEVDESVVPAVEEIIKNYPDFVKVDDLPIEGEDNRVKKNIFYSVFLNLNIDKLNLNFDGFFF